MGTFVFIITGGGSGLGRALALALAKRGKSVLIVGRRQELLQETASASSLISYLCADVSSKEGINAVSQHVNDVENITALINNAGTLKPIISLKDMSMDAWRHTFNVNLDPALFLVQIIYVRLALVLELLILL